jgi:hypothetical protein
MVELNPTMRDEAVLLARRLPLSTPSPSTIVLAAAPAVTYRPTAKESVPLAVVLYPSAAELPPLEIVDCPSAVAQVPLATVENPDDRE